MNRAARFLVLTASCAATVLTANSGSASAQVDSSKHWRYSVPPYAWMAGLTGRVGVGPVAANADMAFGKILDMLNFALMAQGEARRGPWSVGADAMYTSLGKGATIAFRGDTGRLDLSQHQTIIQPVGGYAVGDERWSLDFLGGLRYWHMSASLDVDPARRIANDHSASRDWADATAGVRFRWTTPEFRFALGGDGGGGGSRDTWQLYTSLGYQAWERWTLGLAYRWLWVDYDRNNFLYDARMDGFVLGATYRFR
jgi:opacity protein-like surface antigen